MIDLRWEAVSDEYDEYEKHDLVAGNYFFGCVMKDNYKVDCDSDELTKNEGKVWVVYPQLGLPRKENLSFDEAKQYLEDIIDECIVWIIYAQLGKENFSLDGAKQYLEDIIKKFIQDIQFESNQSDQRPGSG